MALADWTPLSNGSGVYAVIADGTAPSATKVLNISEGGQSFQNITGGPFKNSRVSCWMKQSLSIAARVHLSLRSLDNTTFSAAPASYFLAKIAPSTGGTVQVIFAAVVNGVETSIFSNSAITSQNGSTDDTWQQYRFSTLNSGTQTLLRVEQWNGSAFVPILDVAIATSTFPTLDAAGSCRVGALVTSISGIGVRLDSVNFYSLA